MRIAILGAGALGSVIGAFLFREGRDVSLWDVNKDHLQAIRRDGLIFDGPAGRECLSIPAMRPEEALDTPDLVILLTKTIHTDAALSGIADHINAGSRILTLQNGLGNAERMAAHVPADRLFYGCTMMPGRFIAPGHVATQGNGSATFKAYVTEGTPFARTAAIDGDSFSLSLSDRTDQIIWEKAAFNCAMNTCAALTGARVGDFDAHEGILDLLHAIAAEVVAVAHTQNIPASLETVQGQIAHALAEHTEHKPSMLQDLEAGRPTEIGSLCVVVAEKARNMGVAAPLNTALSALVGLKADLAVGGVM
ncbi:MAG: ketopantoate reductase family protein [Pseudomonadota bacterium]